MEITWKFILCILPPCILLLIAIKWYADRNENKKYEPLTVVVTAIFSIALIAHEAHLEWQKQKKQQQHLKSKPGADSLVLKNKPILVDSDRQRPQLLPEGTKIQGSDKCDICTHFYYVSDGNGGQKLITTEDSDYCCKCDETNYDSEGHEYRVDCEPDGTKKIKLIR